MLPIQRRCEFKNVLGEVGKGVHAYRVFNVAIADVAGTFLLGWLLSKLTGIGFWKGSLIMFLLGQFLHWYFCVDTSVTMFFQRMWSCIKPT